MKTSKKTQKILKQHGLRWHGNCWFGYIQTHKNAEKILENLPHSHLSVDGSDRTDLISAVFNG